MHFPRRTLLHRTRENEASNAARRVFFVGNCEDSPGLAYDEISGSAMVVASLKGCIVEKNLHRGADIHAAIVKLGFLEEDVYVNVSLVNMYAKCGGLCIARDVLNTLPNRNSVSWNAMIIGYADNGYGEEALKCAKCMLNEGICLSGITFLGLVKACGNMRSVKKGLELHAEIVGNGTLLYDVSISSALINMYVKCSMLEQAQELLDYLPSRNVFSWTAMIAGYADHEQGKNALNCFEQMKHEGLSPNPVTYLSVLKACSSIREIDKGAALHAEIMKERLLDENLSIGNALMDLYLKCSEVNKAKGVFDIFLIRDTVSWNILIAGYTQNDLSEEALNSFQQMQQECLLPDSVTVVNVLKACGNFGAVKMGNEVHTRIVGQKLLGRNILVGNALIGMYVKFRALLAAIEVFSELPELNVISWNTIIAGYTQHGYDELALDRFFQMQHEGFSPNAITYVFILKAYGNIGVVENCEEIHEMVVREGMMKYASVGNALVEMYANCGAIGKAQAVFDELPTYDTISWTLLIAGYVGQGYAEESLNHFDKMQHEGVCPNVVTLIYILRACGDLGVAQRGQLIHNDIISWGLMEKDIFLPAALVAMYAKCGLPEKAQEVFHKLKDQNTVCWSSLISGYALCGMCDKVFSTFSRMLQEGVKPTVATFTIFLNACSHSGLLDTGLMCFIIINRSFRIIPTLEHHTCMIDLLSRAGQFDKAIAIISDMPFVADSTVWNSFLGACKIWGNLGFGVSAFQHAMQLDVKDPGAYICMSNLIQLESSHIL